MKRWFFGAVAGALAAVCGVVYAQQRVTADQGAPGAYGSWKVAGPAADGAAIASGGNPQLVAGTDGTLVQTMSVDSAGRVAVIGAAADGAAKTSNPVLVAGEDGTNTQTIATTTTGHVKTAAQPATTGAYGEVAVTNAANGSAVPASSLSGRRTLAINNNGPNDIRCGFNNSVTTATGVTVAANGGFVALDVDDTVTVFCIAKTAAQVTGAATNTWELK